VGSTAKFVVGLFSALFGAMMVYSEQTAPSQAPIVGYIFAFFCFAITIACFSRALRIVAVRIIGAMVFVGTVAYLVYELVNEPGKKYPGPTEPHWLNAIFAIATFGVPGLIVARSGVYPRWAKGAAVFSAEADHGDLTPDLTPGEDAKDEAEEQA
jgi:hypothetical protein